MSARLYSCRCCYCSPLPAQGPGAIAATGRPPCIPIPNAPRSMSTTEDKAAAEGRFDEALLAYEEAARFAPQEGYILERGAALRSKLVRAYVAAAERDALAGQLTKATEELGTALLIDPGNSIVEERRAQLCGNGRQAPSKTRAWNLRHAATPATAGKAQFEPPRQIPKRSTNN